MLSLDAADRAILLALQRDDRLTYAEIAGRVGLSAATVHDRVRKLERRGAIRGYGARVNPAALGAAVTAFVQVSLTSATNCRDVVLPPLEGFPEVEACHSVAGEVDLLLKVRVASPEALEDFLYRLKGVPGVARTSSTVVLSTRFEDRPVVPLAPAEEEPA